jgi:hypothetical protein
LTKVELDIDKDVYSVGEKIKGTFKLIHGGFFEKAEDVKIYLEARGEEKVEVIEKVVVDVVDPNTNQPVKDPQTGQPVKEVKYVPRTQSYTFLKKSLSSKVRSLGTPSSDGYLRIEEGTKSAPFEFVLEGNGGLFESFNGNTIKISYLLIGLVDKKSLLAIDARHELPFRVIKKPEINGQPSKLSESSQNRFMRLTLEAGSDNFRRGDIIDGKVTLNNPSNRHIERVEVGIRSVEIAVANDVRSEIFGANHVQGLAGSWSSGDSRTFKLKIPPTLTPSFTGINSEYNWELSVRASSAGSLAEDLFATHQITIA